LRSLNTVVERAEEFLRDNASTIIETSISIVLVIVILIIAQLVLRRAIRRVLRTISERAESTRRRDAAAIRRRADTMAATVSWGIEIVLILLGASLILGQLGFNVTALAAGIGVVGIALGFGAQTLVKDVINGMFILLEDQFGVGDIVEIAGVAGVVEDINPRRTVLRDLDGNVHIIPNSAITVGTNMTQDYSRINLDVGVAYEEDIDRVIEVVNDVCRELAEAQAEDIVSPPEVLRVQALADSAVVLKILGDVRIGTQWALMGELRRRLKVRFDQEGIEIPYPQRAVTTKTRMLRETHALGAASADGIDDEV
jgi:moderate conductance mechanosensitive channel